MADAPSRKDVLNMFAVEPVLDRATFDRYVKDYPQHERALLRLWRILAIGADKDLARARRMARAGRKG